ncbi:hypothetical protein HP550_17640 [Cellulomonas humilata]|uniref:Uncharacterized protein n=1 Tax=Cellulomonas humilata TaxID=144055 RepID=A0A7Y6DZJ3_9CELL|nr:hypothetical protein [Cellulomonas humilata]NUU19074.1 hypothetical protein [Cellulomonas humilata]
MMSTRHLAFPHVWRERPWADIALDHRELADHNPALPHLRAITESVLAGDGAQQLSALTSHYDLLVTPRPVPTHPPIEYLHVRTDLEPGTGYVVIEHVTPSGRNDKISRPPTEAVALFWRFVAEKFGITSGT